MLLSGGAARWHVGMTCTISKVRSCQSADKRNWPWWSSKRHSLMHASIQTIDSVLRLMNLFHLNHFRQRLLYDIDGQPRFGRDFRRTLIALLQRVQDLLP